MLFLPRVIIILTSVSLLSKILITDIKLENNRFLIISNDFSKELISKTSRDIFNHLVNKKKALQTTILHQTYVVSFSSVTFLILVLLI